MNISFRKANTRKDQAEETRLHLLNTALKVFASKGYNKTSIKDLAREAGISQGLMYHYFTSKEDLLMATVEYHSFLPRLREILGDNREKPFRDVFKEIANQFLKLLTDETGLVNILMQESQTNPEIKKVWAKLLEEGIALLQDFVKGRIAAGEIREHNVKATAYSVFSTLLMFHFTGSALKISQMSRADFIDGILDNLIHGIKAGR
ncbi:MAG: hypothetical protein A2Z02_03685 [Chloroflexi bacterium RBG_16_48_7]|nr:MAG: hypothetical protein A2Z02_03685 [Chloroflexi bacterium RBG_16_48_7]